MKLELCCCIVVIDSAPSLRVYYFLSLTLSVCLYLRLSVCYAAASDRFFFFVSRWNRVIFGRQFAMWHSTKLLSWFFDLGPLVLKIYSPKFFMAHVWWQLRAICAHRGLHVGGSVGGWDPCCHGNDIWARRGVVNLISNHWCDIIMVLEVSRSQYSWPVVYSFCQGQGRSSRPTQ